MKFWKFVGKDNKSILGNLKYTVGETLEAEYIFCLNFTNKMYECEKIALGPKVAILEVEDADIFEFEESGTCLVKKAKVLEIKEPENWMKHGNRNPSWAHYYAADFLKEKEEEQKELYDVIVESNDACWAYNYALDVFKGNDEVLYQIVMNSNEEYYIDLYQKNILKQNSKGEV